MEILQTVKQIGVFMICAQIILHFKPSAKYEKYLKLLISVMVLVQIIMPMVNLLPGEGSASFLTRVQEIQTEIDKSMEQLEIENAVNEENILNTTLEEIKSRINNVIKGGDLQVNAIKYNEEAGDMLIVYVEECDDGRDISIEVDEINVGDSQVMGHTVNKDKLQVLYNALLTEFGITESQVEVVWYG